MTTETKTKEVTFIARCKNLLLTLKPEVWPTKAPSGAIIDKGDPGEHVEFEDGFFRTDDPELIEALRNHPNIDLVGASNGFYEEGRAPDEPKPTVREQLGALARAAARADLEAINEVVEVERDTHKREVVLSTATEYLEALAESDASSKESEPSPSPSTSSETASTV